MVSLLIMDNVRKTVQLQGIIYCIGLRGYVFKFCNGRWVRSTKPKAEVLTAIHKPKKEEWDY
jgi:hypothetical protein